MGMHCERLRGVRRSGRAADRAGRGVEGDSRRELRRIRYDFVLDVADCACERRRDRQRLPDVHRHARRRRRPGQLSDFDPEAEAPCAPAPVGARHRVDPARLGGGGRAADRAGRGVEAEPLGQRRRGRERVADSAVRVPRLRSGDGYCPARDQKLVGLGLETEVLPDDLDVDRVGGLPHPCTGLPAPEDELVPPLRCGCLRLA